MPVRAAAAAGGALLLALLTLALPAAVRAQQEPMCYEPARPSPQAKQVQFGSGGLDVLAGAFGERVRGCQGAPVLAPGTPVVPSFGAQQSRSLLTAGSGEARLSCGRCSQRTAAEGGQHAGKACVLRGHGYLLAAPPAGVGPAADACPPRRS